MKKISPIFRSSKTTSCHAKRGFTLIEVLIASLILSSVFFAILKLISGNSYQMNMLENSKTMDSLFLSSKACIESFGYNTVVSMTSTQSLNFGSDNLSCFTGSYDTNLTFTGISLERTSDTETGVTTFWSSFRALDTTKTLRVYVTISDGREKKDYDFLVGR